jgi:hypothetical protein
MTKKILTLVFLVRLGCLAQQTNTVYLQLASNLTSMPGPLLVTNNVGQTFHTFVVTLGGNGATCGSYPLYANFVANVEVSYDGNQYIPLPQTRVSYLNDPLYNNAAIKIYRAAGSFPYIRLRTLKFPNNISSINCSVSIAYSGSLTGTSINDGLSSNYVAIVTGTAGSCGAIQIANGVDAGSPVKFALVGISITGTPDSNNNMATIYFNGTNCSGSPSLSFYGNGTLNLVPDNNNDPIVGAPYIFAASGGAVNFSVKLAQAGNVVLYYTVLN